MLKCKSYGKKGVSDVIFIIVLIFMFGIFSVFGYLTLSKINDTFQRTGVLGSTGTSIVNTTTTKLPSIVNGLFLLILVGVAIGAIISAFYINSHPAFFIIFVVLGVIIIFLGMMFSNIFHDIMSNPSISTYANDFGVIKFGMDNLPFLILGVMALMVIVLYLRGGIET